VSTFNIRITFEGQDVEETLQTASEFKKNVEDNTSLQSKNILATINTLMTEIVPLFSAGKTW